MLFTDVRSRMRQARLQDSSRTVIAAFIVLAAVAGLVRVGRAARLGEGPVGRASLCHVTLAGLTVVSSWTLVHTVLALHYANMSFRIAEQSSATPPDLGVIFPDEPEPDFLI